MITQGRIQEFFPGGVSWNNVAEKYLGSVGEVTEGGLEKFEYEVL